MPNAIETDFPCSGSTVSRRFTATGTWTLDASSTPTITAELRKADNSLFGSVLTATVTGAPGTAGDWSVEFILTSDADNLTFLSKITTPVAVVDDQPDIEVKETVPLEMNPLRPVPASPAPPAPGGVAAAVGHAVAGGHHASHAHLAAPVNYTVAGTHPGGGVGVVCTAGVCNANGRWLRVLDAEEATLNSPNPGEWTATLRFDPALVPDGQKIAVVAVLLNNRGKVIGRVNRRRKRT